MVNTGYRSQDKNYLESVLLTIVWHELLHSLINPLSDKLFANSEAMTDTQSEWYCTLNESILGAITLRLLIREGIEDTKNLNWHFENSKRNRAPKTEELYYLLTEYEENPDKYDSIISFYPVMQRAFGQPPE